MGFKPKNDLEFAINELLDCFDSGYFKDTFNDDSYYNVRTLKKLNVE